MFAEGILQRLFFVAACEVFDPPPLLPKTQDICYVSGEEHAAIPTAFQDNLNWILKFPSITQESWTEQEFAWQQVKYQWMKSPFR